MGTFSPYFTTPMSTFASDNYSDLRRRQTVKQQMKRLVSLFIEIQHLRLRYTAGSATAETAK
jgi:hypothetical protein